MTWLPRGEQERLRRFYPALRALYGSIVLSVPPDADPAALDVLKGLPDITWSDADWFAGRHAVMRAALETDAQYVQYADCDRIIRWIETQPDELCATVERIQTTDCLIIGRTEAGFATHPMAQQQTERLSNQVCSRMIGERLLDLSSGSKGFSRAAVEFLMRVSPFSGVMGTDSEWVILLHRAGFRLDTVEVEGLDWETADRYLPSAADAETQRRVAAEYDAKPDAWSLRVRWAQEIIDAGYAALERPLGEKT
jgi:hypothetical protein